MSGNKTVEELGKDSGSFHFQYRCFYTEKTFFSIDFFLFRFVNSPSIALKMKFEKRGRERKLEIDGGRDIRDIRILVVIDALSETHSNSVHMNSYMNSYMISYIYQFIYEFRIYTYEFLYMNSFAHEFI